MTRTATVATESRLPALLFSLVAVFQIALFVTIARHPFLAIPLLLTVVLGPLAAVLLCRATHSLDGAFRRYTQIAVVGTAKKALE